MPFTLLFMGVFMVANGEYVPRVLCLHVSFTTNVIIYGC